MNRIYLNRKKSQKTMIPLIYGRLHAFADTYAGVKLNFRPQLHLTGMLNLFAIGNQ